MSEPVFERIVAITEDYLGPAARRFVSRQITFHLEKQPEEVTVQDIPKLLEWTKVTLALLTEDGAMVQEYVDQMSRLK